MSVTEQLALPREGQRCAIGTSQSAGSLHNPAHRRLQLRKRVGQCAARDRGRGTKALRTDQIGGENGSGFVFNLALLENVLDHAIDHFIFDEPCLRLLPQRAAEDSRQTQQRGAAASQAFRTIVVTDQLTTYAEHCVPQL
jgi:hypothetical protein